MTLKSYKNTTKTRLAVYSFASLTVFLPFFGYAEAVTYVLFLLPAVQCLPMLRVFKGNF